MAGKGYGSKGGKVKGGKGSKKGTPKGGRR